VDVRPARRLDERVDDVRRRPHLGVAATQIDERRTAFRRRRGDALEQRDEVLPGKSFETFGARTHPVIVFSRSPALDSHP
jgi:hypothetical protein